ncbi:uncharacterized protein [Triticum aestivum]|uniref:uncharacterized protein n=1 Tax=Triticum aestivum TaxID=4565 RepID=UPI001D031AC4|nr:uncharacterized protein LOC123056808 [Triticum aestivum]
MVFHIDCGIEMRMRKEAWTVITLVAWTIWKHRNDVVFNGALPFVDMVLERINAEGENWRAASLLRQPGSLPIRRPATADALVSPRSATTSPTRQGTTWTLGFGLSPLLDGSTSATTGGRLDLGDEGGEGHDEEDVNAVGLAGARSTLGLVPVEFPSSVAQDLLAANHNGHCCLPVSPRSATPLPTRWGTTARPGARAPPLPRHTRPLPRGLHLRRDWSPRQSRGRRARHGRWRRRGRGGRHGGAQASGCSSTYTGRSPLDLCQESNQNCGSLFTLGLLSAGKRTQSMLDAIGHIDPTAPVYHWKINRCNAVLREVVGENLYKEVIVASPREDEGDFGCIVICGNEVLHGVANFMD